MRKGLPGFRLTLLTQIFLCLCFILKIQDEDISFFEKKTPFTDKIFQLKCVLVPS